MKWGRIVPVFITAAGSVLSASVLFAQDAPGQQASPIAGYETLVAIVGNTGFLVWFGWYTITHTVPRLQAEFGKQLEKERDMFQTILAEKNRTSDVHLQTFITEMRAERESRRSADEKFVEALNRLAERA